MAWKGGEYYAEGLTVRKAPLVRKTATGESITMGFTVCECSEWIGEDGAKNVAKMLNFAEYSDKSAKEAE